MHSKNKLSTRINTDYSITGCRDEHGLIEDMFIMELPTDDNVILEIDIIHSDYNTKLKVKR